MIQDLALRFTHAAAHVLWLGALVALAMFAVERLFTRTATARHAVHLLGLMLTALFLPVAFFLAPFNAERPAPSPVETPATMVVASAPASVEPVTSDEDFVPVHQEGNFEAAQSASAEPPRLSLAEDPGGRWERVAPWVAGAYLVGLLGMIMRMICGFAGSARLRRRGEPVEGGIWAEALRRMGDSIKVRVRPVLKWSREVASPVVIGFAKPAILLPVALASRLSPAQVEAVLAHELAHLRRRDTWALAMQRVVETILFFHPAVWWMSHRMEVAREEACDDLVLAAGCDPADYAEALVTCSECRMERVGISARLASQLAATGKGGERLRRRVLRLIGGGDDGAIRLGRTGWVLGLLLVAGVVLAVLAGNAGRTDLADFDFDDPPPGYEEGIEVADRNQRFKAAGLRFQASPLRWKKEGWLRLPKDQQGPGEELYLNLGVSGGYEVVGVRLFDHATRDLIHDSAWQYPGKHTKNFFVQRIGASNWLRMKEAGGRFPDRIDVWMRLVTERRGHTFILPAKTGAAASHEGSELVITKLLSGAMSGRSGPTGEMQWDLSTASNEDRMTTVDIENRGDLLRGRYHLVAVKKDGSRHPMDHTHFRDFRNMGRHAYFLMDVALGDVDHFELVPFKDRHKFFFNGLAVPREELPELSQYHRGRIEAWASELAAGRLSEQDFLLHVNQTGPQAVRGLIPLMKSGRTDVAAIKGIEQFLEEPAVVEYLAETLRDLADKPAHILPNTAHCCLVLLGRSGEQKYADLVARFIGRNEIAAIVALGELGGDKARDYLIGAFDRIPTDKWWLLAQQLGRLGDSTSVPELKRRLAMVELPPNDRFPPRTVFAFTEAIGALSEEDRLSTTLCSWSQSVRFRYPYDGRGLPKSFSVNPQRDYYIHLPDVDPQTEEGRRAIWQAFEERTEGPGFTMDGDEIVTFHGLRVVPLWEDGPPYPTTWTDWLNETSHRELLERIQKQGQEGRIQIPQDGLLLGLDAQEHLHVISLEKTTDDFQYGVSMKALDPLRMLVAAPSEKEAFVEWSYCTLHDLKSGAKNGALNLNRTHMVNLSENLAASPGSDAILEAIFLAKGVGLLVPGAGDFVMTPLDGETSASDLVATLRTVEQPSVPGHERLDRGDRITHTFENLEAGNWFGFAVRMPGGVPVAGLMEIRNVDRGMKTLDIRHRFLKTDGARAVFAEPHHADQELGLVFRHLKEQETDETPFVGEWTAEVPEDLGDYRLALGVMDVDGNDLSLVRTHVDDYAGYNAEAVEEYWRNFQVRARGLAFPGHQ